MISPEWTQRDDLAAGFLAAMIGNSQVLASVVKLYECREPKDTQAALVRVAFEYADAFLRYRKEARNGV